MSSHAGDRVVQNDDGGIGLVIGRVDEARDAGGPCALLKYVKHPGPIASDPDKCVGCKSCMRIGCPAISIADGKAVIDNTLCTGCGVCTQLCKFDALGGKKEA